MTLQSTKYIWYVSYGSNMNYKRFLTYIMGGKHPLSSKTEVGCKDRSLPLKRECFKMTKDLTFKNHSSRWDGSVLFLDLSSNNEQFFVRYLIKADQFIDVVKQENNIKIDQSINLSVDDFSNKQDKVIFKDHWYKKLIYLGEHDGHSMYTFSCDDDMLQKESKKTSLMYLKTIFEGLKQYDITDEEIITSFRDLDGVRFYKESDLKLLL